LGKAVQGTPVILDEDGAGLGQYGDLLKVKKVYKLADVGGGRGKKGAKGGHVDVDVDVDERKEIEGVILGIMSAKGT
jgi:hypothetical protein